MHQDRIPAISIGVTFAVCSPTYLRRRRLRNAEQLLEEMLLQAACEGQGIALGWSLLVDDLLVNRTLVRPLDVALESPNAFYFVRSTRDASPGTVALQSWLTAQVTCGSNHHARSASLR
jgi:DNA-binding transcriptional LysR family regulator